MTVVTYNSDGTGPSRNGYLGDVKPHENLGILYDAHNSELSSTADLAAIILRSPPTRVAAVPIAAKEVKLQQAVVLVGFGKDGAGGEGTRRFGPNEIASIEKTGATFLVGKPVVFSPQYEAKKPVMVREVASYSLAGDSGGPCLREREDGGVELVGITKTYYGGGQQPSLVEYSEYTSTHFYQEWIRSVLWEAEKRDTD